MSICQCHFPVWFLFELGVIFSRIIGNRKKEKETESEETDEIDEDEDEPRYRPMTDEEMEAELDAIEREDEGP